MKNMSKIVFLQKETLGEDVDLEKFNNFEDISFYEHVTQDQVINYAKDAEIVITNKNLFNKEVIDSCPHLKLIALTATGANNVDLEYAKEKGIVVENVSGYSTDAVAQLTMAMALSLVERLSHYDGYVKSGTYSENGAFSYFGNPFHTLSSLRWGIVGLGAIGRKVASIASAFGAEVVYTSFSGVDRKEEYERVSFEKLCRECDVISIHSPLTDKTHHLFDEEVFKMMKSSAILINVGRGPIVEEKALVKALNNEEIYGAGLDVYEKEPLEKSSGLLQLTYPERAILTPHVGWGSVEARQKCADEVYENVRLFIEGTLRNVVNE
jgi:glycerate dehydrogenase